MARGVGTAPGTSLLRIGWDTIIGRIEPETLDILADGNLETMETITFDELPEDAGTIVAVRDPVEHLAGVISGARLSHLVDIATDPEAYSSDELFVHC